MLHGLGVVFLKHGKKVLHEIVLIPRIVVSVAVATRVVITHAVIIIVIVVAAIDVG